MGLMVQGDARALTMHLRSVRTCLAGTPFRTDLVPFYSTLLKYKLNVTCRRLSSAVYKWSGEMGSPRSC